MPKLSQIEKVLTELANQANSVNFSAIKKEGEFWRQSPPALLGYQRRWLADQSIIKLAEKSRRVGLTWAEACDCVLDAARIKGRSTIYTSYNFDMTESFIKDCAFWARSFSIATSEIQEEVLQNGDDSILIYLIRFASGNTIKALSGKPTNIRGKQARVVIDEAAFCDNLPELLKAAIALLMWGGRISIISSHNGEENPFNELLKEVQQGDRHFSHHRITLQDALSDGLYERICLVQGIPATPENKAQWIADLYADYGSAAAEELDCEPAAKKGDLIYSHFDPALNHCNDYPLNADRLHIGMDFNVGKMAAIVHVIREGMPRAVDEFVNLQDTPAMIRAIKERFPRHDAAGLITVYPDASGASKKSTNAQESDLSLIRAAGFSVIVDSTNPPVKDRINAMNTAFNAPDGRRDYLVNTHRCPHYKQSLLKQVWKGGEPDKTGGWDHPNDAAGYVIVKLLPVVKVQQYAGRSAKPATNSPKSIRQLLGG